MACSQALEALQAWLNESGGSSVACVDCDPGLERSSSVSESPTRLGRDILDYVVDAAVIHMETPEGAPYRLTVGDVAACLGKTPAQLAHALVDLELGGWLRATGERGDRRAPAKDQPIFPTAKALLAFATFSDERLEDLERRLESLAANPVRRSS